MANNIFDFIKEEETAFKTVKVPVADGYDFNLYDHVRVSTLFRDSKFTKGENDFSRPFKNIIRRIRNIALVAMDFDVKDIEPFVNSSDDYYKSFLTRKFYPNWARRNNIDTFIDEMIESYEDYGLVLVKHLNQVAPEVVKLQSLAFCDQTDILSGPIGIRHQYSPSQLKDMAANGWKNIDEVITLAKKEYKPVGDGQAVKTPGKFIEVYEVDGMFPKAWLKDEDISDEDETTYSQQLHIVAFYVSEGGAKQGITLFKGKGDKDKYKALKRDDIFGRAAGMGGVEELFEAQLWTNYDMIRIQDMLDAASKIAHVTNDTGFTARNDTDNIKNNQVLTIADGKTINQLNMQPVNLQAFVNASAQWEAHAQGVGSANDALLGESPSSGTPFKLQEAVISQGKGVHERRRGKLATFLGEIHRDWILSDLVKEMNNEQEFMEELTLEELQYVADRVAIAQWNNYAKEKVLNGQSFNAGEQESYIAKTKQDFMNGGGTRFFKLLKDELKDLPIDVHVNIAGKQKDLAGMTDKLVNIFRTVIGQPQVLQNPPIAKIFNQILSSAGLDEVNFAGLAVAPAAPAQSLEPLKELVQPSNAGIS
jgi:hypothetical protein